MHHNKKIYLFANWKMYLDHAESVTLARQLATAAKNQPAAIETVVFPSALSFVAVHNELHNSSTALGSQNTYWIPRGGATGEISADMFAAVGATYVLVGHSERRHMFHETNHDVRQKIEAVLTAGLTPVICVGETMAERDGDTTKEVLEVQLRSALEDLIWPTERPLIVAYEPVWAISKGTEAETITPCDHHEAQKAHQLIRQFVGGLLPGVEPILLYGGSVRVHNVGNFLRESDINGVLIGAAATTFESWQGIVREAERTLL